MLYLAEFYLAADSSVAEVARRASAGAGQNPAAVRLIQAVFVPSDECCFLLYAADSAEDVITAGALAGLEFDRIGRCRLARANGR
jgi:hypothetical protein